jgi:hypothetical protein
LISILQFGVVAGSAHKAKLYRSSTSVSSPLAWRFAPSWIRTELLLAHYRER